LKRKLIYINYLHKKILDGHSQPYGKNYTYPLPGLVPRLTTSNVIWDSKEIDIEQVYKYDQFKVSITQVLPYINDLFIYSHPTLEKQRAIIAMLDAEIEKKQ
tara:strand:+ start:670 stop:975 length:306 start_codon:yes stop_codon:yes gene_type:complete